MGGKYDSSIDMWSFGALLAEISTGQPLFAGANETDQLASILEVIRGQSSPPSMWPLSLRLTLLGGYRDPSGDLF